MEPPPPLARGVGMALPGETGGDTITAIIATGSVQRKCMKTLHFASLHLLALSPPDRNHPNPDRIHQY